MRGPIVFSLLAFRLPRTTPAKSRTGSTAIAGPVQPEWQIESGENAVVFQMLYADFSAVISHPKLRRCPPLSNDGVNCRS